LCVRQKPWQSHFAKFTRRLFLCVLAHLREINMIPPASPLKTWYEKI
jgi:hypothetical protein